VDSYNGSVNFYIVDENDPLINSYKGIFPGLFKSITDMPEGIKAHIRYPTGVFEIQSQMYARYHMQDPQVFYNQEDLWTIPHELFHENRIQMEPYYTIMKLPEESKEEYILMLPFTPTKRDNMISWMAARSDEPHYGEIQVYRFPKEKLVYGPMQIEARIDQDAYISQQFTLWGQRGSQIIRGNTLVIPIEDSIVYIEPVYLQAERGKIPELRRVIVAYQERIVMEENLELALRKIFEDLPDRVTASGQDSSMVKRKSVKQLSGHAYKYFQRAQKAQRDGNWEKYGEELKKLEEILKELSSSN